jgi:hypothetical protein
MVATLEKRVTSKSWTPFIKNRVHFFCVCVCVYIAIIPLQDGVTEDALPKMIGKFFSKFVIFSTIQK